MDGCAWAIVDENGEPALQVGLKGLLAGNPHKVDGTTHLQALHIDGAQVELALWSAPMEVDEATVVWSPLKEFEGDGVSPAQSKGLGGALVVAHGDGAQTTVVWRRADQRSETKVLYAVHSE